MSEPVKEKEISGKAEQVVAGAEKAENESSGGVHDSPSASTAAVSSLAVSPIETIF